MSDGSETPDDDPFADFEDYDDRESDPFAHLDGPDRSPGTDPADHHSDRQSDRTGSAPDHEDGWGENTAWENPEWENAARAEPERSGRDSGQPDNGLSGGGQPGSGPESGPAGGSAAEPLGDVDTSRGDPFESGAGASVFEQVDVSGIDPDEAWERFTGEGEGATGSDAASDEFEDDVVEVSKHSFCEGCEFFSPPPDVECGHEGTSILEFTDMESVRVANCPVVAERRELGEFDDED